MEHLLDGLPGGLAEDLVDVIAQAHELARLVVDVGRLPARSAGRVVQHDARVGQRVPLPLRGVHGVCKGLYIHIKTERFM